MALLVDDFPAHKSGLEIVKVEGELSSVEVIFLSINATSYCQPLDQGIIRSWKAHYHHRWVQHMVDKHTANRDPKKTVEAKAKR